MEVPSLDGKKLLLKVPSGTQSGKVFRISSKGLPRLSAYGKGNLYVQVNIEIPKKLTREQKNMLKDLKKQGL